MWKSVNLWLKGQDAALWLESEINQWEHSILLYDWIYRFSFQKCWMVEFDLYSVQLYTYPQLTLSPSESKHNSSKIIPAHHLLGNSWWNLEDLRCSPARQYQYIVVIFRWKMIGFTRWMIPAAVNQTEMNIEISCANLKKCAFYILLFQNALFWWLFQMDSVTPEYHSNMSLRKAVI